MYYDKKGKPITLMQWAQLTNDEAYRRISLTADGEHRVSTVWLGLDHNWGSGKKQIFETMVFKQGSWSDLDCQRYSTLSEAKKGHRAMVKKWL